MKSARLTDADVMMSGEAPTRKSVTGTSVARNSASKPEISSAIVMKSLPSASASAPSPKEAAAEKSTVPSSSASTKPRSAVASGSSPVEAPVTDNSSETSSSKGVPPPPPKVMLGSSMKKRSITLTPLIGTPTTSPSLSGSEPSTDDGGASVPTMPRSKAVEAPLIASTMATFFVNPLGPSKETVRPRAPSFSGVLGSSSVMLMRRVPPMPRPASLPFTKRTGVRAMSPMVRAVSSRPRSPKSTMNLVRVSTSPMSGIGPSSSVTRISAVFEERALTSSARACVGSRLRRPRRRSAFLTKKPSAVALSSS